MSLPHGAMDWSVGCNIVAFPGHNRFLFSPFHSMDFPRQFDRINMEYAVGTQTNHLNEMVLLSTKNQC